MSLQKADPMKKDSEIRPPTDVLFGRLAIDRSYWWKASELRLLSRRLINRLSLIDRLTSNDYVIGCALIAACFVLFFNEDIYYIGWESLNYLFSDPSSFYENNGKIQGTVTGTSYPPSIYLIFALWLYPLKLFGWIVTPLHFEHYYVYWLKLLTTIVYAGTGAVFYRICLLYYANKDWARYATAAWLTMPMALLSQFVFSQCDVFYVFLTLVGVLLLLKGNLKTASLCFGVGITFKYFPTFVFIPLLLLSEKRPSRIITCVFIFLLPSLVVELVYGRSPAYIEGVQHLEVLNRVYAAAIDLGDLKIYGLPAAFAILCGLAYFTEFTGNKIRLIADVWLISAVLPFTFITWHPQWIIFLVPPLVLTTMLHQQRDKIVLLDLIGMFLFVGTVSLTFLGSGDAVMFRGAQFGLEFTNSYRTADLFNWFGDHSRNLFFTGFLVYLVFHIILKLRPPRDQPLDSAIRRVDYSLVRYYLYVGLAIFILPTSLVIYRSLKDDVKFAQNLHMETKYTNLSDGQFFEQSFVASGNALKQVSLPLETLSLWQQGSVLIEIVDADGRLVGTTSEILFGSQEFNWHKFTFNSVPVIKNSQYRIRLSSPTGMGIAWWGSRHNSYEDGQAFVDGRPKNWDFAFRIAFVH